MFGKGRILFPCIALAGVALGCSVGVAADDSAAPASNNVTVSFATTGSVEVDFTFRHAADAQHYCGTSADPWAHVESNGQMVEVPPGPPKYELVYDAGARRAGSHSHLTAFNYQLGQTTHSDPADDWIDFWADGDQWIGHGGSADPAFQIEVKFAADGKSGSFVAHHLRAARDGKISPGNQTVDVKGEWQCPFGTAPGASP